MDKSTQTILPNVDSNTSVEEIKPRKPRGFAAMKDKNRLKEIARAGGKSAHQLGRAHKFSHDEAVRAGQKGGSAPHISRGRVKKIVDTSEPLPEMSNEVIEPAPKSKAA